MDSERKRRWATGRCDALDDELQNLLLPLGEDIEVHRGFPLRQQEPDEPSGSHDLPFRGHYYSVPVATYYLPNPKALSTRQAGRGPYRKPLHGCRPKHLKTLIRPIPVRERSYLEVRALLLGAPGSARGMRGRFPGLPEPAGVAATPSTAKDACRTSLVPPSCLQPPDLGHAR